MRKDPTYDPTQPKPTLPRKRRGRLTDQEVQDEARSIVDDDATGPTFEDDDGLSLRNSIESRDISTFPVSY